MLRRLLCSLPSTTPLPLFPPARREINAAPDTAPNRHQRPHTKAKTAAWRGIRAQSFTCAGASLLLLLLLIPLRPATAQPSAENVLIGFAGGLALPQVQNARNAALLAVDDANQTPLHVQERRLRFKLWEQDDKSEKLSVQYAARTFVDGGAVAVIGHWTSSATITAAPIYHAASMAQVTPYSWSKGVTRMGFTNSFQIIPNDESGLMLAARHFAGQGARKIFIVDDGQPLGAGMADDFEKGANQAGLTLVGRATVSSKTSDFNAVLKRAKELAPDVLFFSGRVSQSDMFIRGAIRLDVPGKILLTDSVVSQDFLERSGPAQDRVFALSAGPAMEKSAAFQKLKKRYADRFHQELLPSSIFAYDSVHAIAAAIRQAGSTQPVQVVTALRQIRVEGVSGTIRFNAQGALQAPSYTLYQIKGQRWEPVALLQEQ